MRANGSLAAALRFAVLALGIHFLCAASAGATDVSGNCPAGGFTAAGSPWNFTGSVTVPAATTCTVQAGATLNGNGGSLSVSGTLNAVGTSTAARDVVFNNVLVSFQATSVGTLQFCTLQATETYGVVLQGAQTVDSCTVSASGNADYGIVVAGGAPTISNNTLTAASYGGIYVDAGTPAISNNTITASRGGILYAAGGGTASGNTIGFSGRNPGRFGIAAWGTATPTLSGNTILDAAGVSDIAISASGTAAGIQIVNNTIRVSRGDVALQLSPALFQAGSQVSGNSFPTGLAAGVEITGQVEGTVTVGRLLPAAGTTVSTYVVHNLNVPVAATLTVAAGVTLTGGSSTGYLSVSGTLNAAGTSTAARDVVFNSVGVNFQPTSVGTLQFCTLQGANVGLYLQGAQTVDSCTVSANPTAIYAAGGAPTVSNNTLTAASYGIYVAGTPALSNNTITAGFAGIYYEAGGGTASGNTIGFSGGNGGRFGVFVAGSAMPTLNGNTIFDDRLASDAGIAVQQGTGNAMTQIVNNMICTSGGDTFIDTPANFAGTVSGNLNQCGPPTSTPTQMTIPTATRTPPTATLTPTKQVALVGQVLVPGAGGAPGSHEQVPLPNVEVDLFLCPLRQPCVTRGEPIASVFTGTTGRFTILIGEHLLQDKLPVVSARVSPTFVLRAPVVVVAAAASGSGALLRPRQAMGDTVIDSISEAAVRLLEEQGFENYDEAGVAAVVQAVEAANAGSNFENFAQMPEAAVAQAQTTAAADPAVQMALEDNKLPPGCVGDCDNSGAVAVEEVIKGVNIALGSAMLGTCEPADADGSGTVSINELILAVNNALNGCH